MCTVTYIPKENDQFILTSNRDESAARSPQQITKLVEQDPQLIFPRDKTAGGTWIAVADNDRVVCLLNGAFERHVHQPPYTKSRGIMVLEFFESTSASAFHQNYIMKGMEPFTMIVAERTKLHEIRWDGTNKHFRKLDAQQPHIWSSATLYPPPIQAKRETWFAQWLTEQNCHFTSTGILNFHKNAGDGDPENDLLMNRNNIVQTVSITCIIKGQKSIQMQYHDLIHDALKKAEVQLKSETLESH